MIFKKNGGGNRRLEPPAPPSPRIARLIRDARTDPGFSYSGPAGPIHNKGGVVGAWLADLLLYLFGASAWWWVAAGVVIVVGGYRRVVHPDHESDHPLPLRAFGFALTLVASAAVEALRLWKLPFALPQALNFTSGRKAVRELTGSDEVPVLVLDDGEFVAGTKEIVSWAKANPAS